MNFDKRLSIHFFLRIACPKMLFMMLFFIIIHTSALAQKMNSLSKSDTSEISQKLLDVENTKSLADTAKVNQLLEESKRLKFNKGIVESYLSLGAIHNNNGLYSEGKNYFNNALKISKSTEDSIESLNGLASSYNYIGDFESATKIYLDAVQKTTLSNHKDKEKKLAEFYYKLATVFEYSLQYDKANMYIDLALNQSRTFNSPNTLLPKSWNLKGMILFHQKQDYQQALLYLDSAVTYAEQHQYIQTLHPSLANKGVILNGIRKYDEAITTLEKALFIAQENATIKGELIGTLAELGLSYMNAGMYSSAEKYFLEAWNKAQHLPKQKLYLSYQLGVLYQQKKQFQQSILFKDIYISLRDSIYNKTLLENMQRMEAEYSSLEKDKALLSNQLLIAHQKNELSDKNFWIFAIAVSSFFLIGLIVIISIFRNNKRKAQEEVSRLKSIIEGEERERKRISQELHDGVSSQLNAIKLKLGHSEQQYKDKAPELEEMIDQTSSDLRNIAYNLTEKEVMSVGLSQSIYFFFSRTFDNSSFKTDLQIYEGIDNISSDLALNVYRIIQELVQNVIKHANANHITVMLIKNESKLLLLVEDNGKPGFLSGHKKGLGIENIMQRVKAHEGKLKTMQNTKGFGWVTEIEFPV